MPTIDISDEVLALIRGFAQSEDETDEAVLKRILEAARADHNSALRAYEKADQDISSTN